MSKILQEQFEIRVQERRNHELIHLLQYLRFPYYLNVYEDHFGNKIRRSQIAALATSLLETLIHRVLAIVWKWIKVLKLNSIHLRLKMVRSRKIPKI